MPLLHSVQDFQTLQALVCSSTKGNLPEAGSRIVTKKVLTQIRFRNSATDVRAQYCNLTEWP